MTPEALLERTYAAFNARDVDAVLVAMHADVDWPNGMEGGRVNGHRAVREYWTRQWGLIDPRVEPRGFTTEADGRIAVDVRQVVRDRAGALVKDEMVQHVYRIEEGLIRSMEIRPGPGGSGALSRGSAAPGPRRRAPRTPPAGSARGRAG
ncbi:MAG TPA: nuclear transport factor 2 family protein [Methylomirabilota bacterium]|jgi:hypothetical protein